MAIIDLSEFEEYQGLSIYRTRLPSLIITIPSFIPLQANEGDELAQCVMTISIQETEQQSNFQRDTLESSKVKSVKNTEQIIIFENENELSGQRKRQGNIYECLQRVNEFSE